MDRVPRPKAGAPRATGAESGQSAASPIEPSPQDPFAELPLLDLETFGRFRELLPVSTLEGMYKACIDGALDHCKHIEHCASRGDRRAIRAALHAIAGSAAMVGAVRLAGLARRLESQQGGPDTVAETAEGTSPGTLGTLTDANLNAPPDSPSGHLHELVLCCQQLSHKLKHEGISV